MIWPFTIDWALNIKIQSINSANSEWVLLAKLKDHTVKKNKLKEEDKKERQKEEEEEEEEMNEWMIFFYR